MSEWRLLVLRLRLRLVLLLGLGSSVPWPLEAPRLTPHAFLVKIEYDASTPNSQLGWILYLKLAVTGVEPVFVRDYRREKPAFPHQTTDDQFFDEEQFEAYRPLGACVMEGMFRKDITGNVGPASVGSWFQFLANNLLPDNDVAFH